VPLTKESIILKQPRMESKHLKLDYKKILESYINLQKKIDKMVDYVFTDECRFRFILKYFGESVNNYNCNKCDRCLTDVKSTENIKKYISEVILKTLAESQNNLTSTLLINILRGTAKSIDSPEISSFGVCRNYTRDELKRIIHFLIEQDFISEIKEKQKQLKITEKGLAEIEEEAAINNREDSEDYLDNLGLYNLLREARSKISKKFNQNGLIICPDETMREIAAKKPKTKTEFLLIKGTSPRMFNKVGEDFLEIIKNYVSDTKEQIISGEQKNLPANIQETYSLLKKGYSLKDISELRKTSEAIISMQVESIIEYDPKIDIGHLFNTNELKKINSQIEKGYVDLKDLKFRLDDSVSYPMLRIAVAKHKNSLSSSQRQESFFKD
jgi:ATP-dependent DNA helicase RecQ